MWVRNCKFYKLKLQLCAMQVSTLSNLFEEYPKTKFLPNGKQLTVPVQIVNAFEQNTPLLFIL
jgi:hypothetical protein